MKKQSRKSLTRKLDKICSDIIRKNPCQRCGENDYSKLQCAHIYSRTYRSVRWYLKNMVCLCAACHFWAHKNPILFSEFIKSTLGEVEYNILKSIATPIKKWTLQEIEEIYLELKKMFNKIGEGQ